LRGYRALRHPGFRIYVVGMLFRGLSMWMPMVAIPWLVVELGATPTEVGIATGFFFLPTFFVGPMSGVFADRVERRNVLVAAQLFAAVLSAAIFLVVISGSQTLPVLMAASFGFGLLIAVEVPVRQAFMTEMVPRADISSAASLHATVWNSARLLGPVVAGIMIGTFGSWSPFAFSALAAFLVALSYLWMDRYRERGRQRADRSHSVLSDLRGGATFAFRHPVVRLSLVCIWAGALFAMATFTTLAPLYVQDELGLGAEGYGLFLGASGAGALVAALLVTTFAHGDRRRWMIGGLLSLAAIMVGIGLAQAPLLAFGFAFLFGTAQIVLSQNALVSVHAATPDELRGRVMGLWVTNFQGSSLFGSILAGALAGLLGIREAMLATALVLAIIGLGATVAIRRADWQATPVKASGS
jgi:MFS family permease